MKSIEETINALKNSWSSPHTADIRGEVSPFTMLCTFSENGVTQEELKKIAPLAPKQLERFWSICSNAKLFVDQEYGQWGLEILSPTKALEETLLFAHDRSTDFEKGDLVVGRFLGDADLLIVRCDTESPDYGNILIALPIDRRVDWYQVSDSFESFLSEYAVKNGDKYWE